MNPYKIKSLLWLAKYFINNRNKNYQPNGAGTVADAFDELMYDIVCEKMDEIDAAEELEESTSSKEETEAVETEAVETEETAEVEVVVAVVEESIDTAIEEIRDAKGLKGLNRHFDYIKLTDSDFKRVWQKIVDHYGDKEAAAEAMQKASGRLNQTVINKMMEGFDQWGTI